MSAPYRARWLNPVTGAYSAISTNIANTGTQVFTPPGNNGSGFTDWSLVLDIIAGGPPNGPPPLRRLLRQRSTQTVQVPLSASWAPTMAVKPR